MERYNYLDAIENDVLDYIKEELDLCDFSSIEELEDDLNDRLWTVDSVTGNASGSYTFNAWQAEEYVAHNLDLLAEAMNEFGSGFDLIEEGAEAADVTIRCYLLNQAISNVLHRNLDFDEMWEDAHNDEE